MTKGPKLRSLGYFLEIKTVRSEQWVYPIPCRTLQEAVERASEYVQDMDQYLKVYRHARVAGGVYISTFLSNPTEEHPERTLIVQITAYELLTQKEIDAALKHIAYISKDEKSR